MKYSEDSLLLTLLQGREEVDHGDALTDFVTWCDDSLLDLNVKKTKEIIVDFRRKPPPPIVSNIHGADVEIVDNYKYLGTEFDSKLDFHINTESIAKRGQQRVHLLRKWRSFGVCKRILTNCYSSFIESLLTFSFVCWFGKLFVKDKNILNGVVNICSKIIGAQQRDLSSLWRRRVVQKAEDILRQPDHVLYDEFVLLPLGKRFLVPEGHTNRYRNSFIPSAIKILNEEGPTKLESASLCC